MSTATITATDLGGLLLRIANDPNVRAAAKQVVSDAGQLAVQAGRLVGSVGDLAAAIAAIKNAVR